MIIRSAYLFLKDQVTISLDTTGIPLHKRGYRKLVSEAPIRETLAAALLIAHTMA